MPTQKDVAKIAGVSSATVSAVINENKYVSPELKKKVRHAIHELNYEINSVARSLKSNRTNTIGVIVGNVLSSFYSVLARSTEENAKKHGFSIILCNGDDNPEEELKYLKVLKSNRVDGIILTPTGKNKSYINQLMNTKTRLVLVDRLIDGVDCDAVLVDNLNGAYKAVKHLIENGYRKIAIIDGFTDRTTGRERLDGYLKALDEYNIPRYDDLIKIGTFKKRSGMELSRQLLESSSRPEAIFTANVDITLGAMQVIKEMNLSVPDDIAIVGFDEAEWSTIVDPPLTCISQPTARIGMTAVELLVEKINNLEKFNKDKPRIIKLDTELLIRESSNIRQEVKK